MKLEPVRRGFEFPSSPGEIQRRVTEAAAAERTVKPVGAFGAEDSDTVKVEALDWYMEPPF